MSTKLNEEDDDSSSPSKPNKDKKKQKSSHDDKDSAPSPKSPDSDSPESAPSESPPPSPVPQPSPPPQLKQPISPPPRLKLLSPPLLSPLSEDLSPSPSPPPQPSPSPSPPPPSPLPPSPPPPSLPPPSSPPPSLSPPSQSLPLLSGNSSPPPYFPRKQSPPLPSPPQFHAPSPLDRPSSRPRHNAPSNDSSTPGTSDMPQSSHQAQHDVASHANSTGSSPASSSSSGDNSGKYVGYTLAGIFAVALVAVAVALVFAFKRKKSRGDVYATPYMPPLNIHVKSGANGHYYVQQPITSPPLARNGNVSMNHLGASLDSAQFKSAQIVFTYEMVMEMTNAFSSQNVIGEGGFGCVYKGWLPDGKAVAVKQLKAGSGQGEREFKAEVEIISRVHHRHLVALVGYCICEQQKILIYEYVPNGTLHHHLHASGMPVLDWTKRLKIAIGAAKGLAYLHEDCSQKIIHRDIKSANILLDNAYEAQVADFGLARLADAANTHVSTRVMGTFGYMAPEYATSGKLTDRSDVFSFGVVLLELVTGRKPVDQTQPLGDESLVEWARPLLLRAIETRDFSDLIDPRLQKHFVESEMFRMIEAAAACVRHSAPKRPRMVQVVRALDCGDESSDLSNGVKYGHSTVYDSGQYDKEIMLFRRMANGTFVDSDFDMYSREYSLSRDTSMTSRGSQQELIRHSSSGESESRAITMHRSSTE